jgi:hypothetical protein
LEEDFGETFALIQLFDIIGNTFARGCAFASSYKVRIHSNRTKSKHQIAFGLVKINNRAL